MKAAFLDRDGTLIDDPGYLGDPARVRLLPGVAAALIELERLGYLRIVITNQSGIARGLIDEQQVNAVHEEIERQLAAQGATITAWYFCPHLPELGCDCRKPGTALHRAAASRFGIDLPGSWCIGDRIGDVQAGVSLGARSILVLTGDGADHEEQARTSGADVASDLATAVELIAAAG